MARYWQSKFCLELVHVIMVVVIPTTSSAWKSALHTYSSKLGWLYFIIASIVVWLQLPCLPGSQHSTPSLPKLGGLYFIIASILWLAIHLLILFIPLLFKFDRSSASRNHPFLLDFQFSEIEVSLKYVLFYFHHFIFVILLCFKSMNF